VAFEAVVEPLAWGRSIYMIIRLDPGLVAAAQAAGTHRVEGTIDGEPVNVGVNRADVVADAFLYAGQGLRRRLGVRPGDVVACRLRPADPDAVPLPADVHQALVDAGLLEAFEQRPPPDRRRLLQPIESAARAATREQRMAAMLDRL
jgi:hypothetical protein